jgi:hypothetical protein
MDTDHRCIQLTDISDEIILLILNKLSNIEVLYSLIGVNIRFDKIASDPLFTNHLTLLKRSSNGIIKLLDDHTFDCLYFQILPKIHHKIKWLDLEPLSMKRVLLSIDYPNLYGLSLFNIERELAVRFFGGKYSFISIDLIVELWNIYETESHSICS